MRVLVVTNMYPTASSPRRGVFVQREVDGLKGIGHEVVVVHVDTSKARSRYLTGRRVVAEALASFKPDIVHVHYGLSLALLPDTQDTPVVCTFHGSDLSVGWQRFICRLFLRRVHAAIVVARWMIRHVSDRIPSVAVIPCAASLAAPCPSHEVARRLLGLSEGTHLLFPSSPTRSVKRYSLFRKAVEGVMGATALVLDEVDPAEVPTWLAASDCVVLTSSTEGSPVVTKEALVCGTRVVSVDVGDMADQLKGFSGCALTDPVPEVIASTIVRCLSEPRPNADVARARFGLKREVEAVSAVYHGLTGGGADA